MNQYYKAIIGDEFDPYKSYGELIYAVWVALFFGLGMPLLYPITFFILVILYLTDRYHIENKFRVSSAMGSAVNSMAIFLLRVIIYLAFINQFYMVYNYQRFGNKLNKIEYKYVNMVTEFEGNDWKNYHLFIKLVIVGALDLVMMSAVMFRSQLSIVCCCKYNRTPDKNFAQIVSKAELNNLKRLIKYLQEHLTQHATTAAQVFGVVFV